MSLKRSAMRASLPCLLATGLCLLAIPEVANATGDEPRQEEPATNQMQRIETKGRWIEFEVSSTKEFPVRALPPVLSIGEQTFSLSRNPEDGRLDTLIFRIPADRFASLENGAPVEVFYALSMETDPETGRISSAVKAPGEEGWTFGPLQKSLLDNPRPEREEER